MDERRASTAATENPRGAGAASYTYKRPRGNGLHGRAPSMCRLAA